MSRILSNKNPVIAMPAMPSINNTTAISRRGFLVLFSKICLALSGFLGLGGILRFFNAPTQKSPKTRFELGPADQLPPGSRKKYPEAQAVIMNTPQGFIALSTVCPHLGCQVEQQEVGYACPCHGSRFNPDGHLLNGPAKENLRKLRLELDNQGFLTLYTH